ncbi:MAG: hypothetical protein ACWA6X_10975, partial [Bauldia sp.]
PTQTATAAPAQRPTPPAPTPPAPTPAPQPAAAVPTPEPPLPVVAAPTTAPTLDEILNTALANANAAAQQPAPAQQPLGVASGTQTAAMTQTERAALIGMIRDAVGRCWNPPQSPNPADVRVVLQFRLNRDGTVGAGLPTVVERPNSPYAAAAVDSAQRAIYVCAPYAFPADLYDGPDGWQEVRVIFDPREMF